MNLERPRRSWIQEGPGDKGFREAPEIKNLERPRRSRIYKKDLDKHLYSEDFEDLFLNAIVV